ncbi:uncharacterized protein LOC111867079 isoform X1 [Cryptotermes secundus]|uniref:uncharacterized protein LOC111867079 isoform X1 n=2 Tax=Cryptotermes secundus TaxID=105785 RepID=UPI000CD7CEF6|nr:uncharacterized protein LOC111867079 isoform X1 [Cryptotermes secundus]
MAANSPLLRPLGIAAGSLGSFQALTWGILSLLGILVYAEVIYVDITANWINIFRETLVQMYFKQSLQTEDIMSSGTVAVWTSIYFSTSVIWLVTSGLLLYDFRLSKYTSSILIGWVAVTGAVSAIDFAGTVAFGVDYNSVQRMTDIQNSCQTNILLVPIFLMIMCARGFVLWIMNVGLVIYLGVAAWQLNKKEPAELSCHQSISPPEEPYLNGRQNPSFQQEPISAWDIQSPTVGQKQRNPWQFAENNWPHSLYGTPESTKILPRVATPVSTPVAPVAPLPIPQPDYSPPLGRPVKHEPNQHDYPLRSALKKPQPYGRTIF